MVQSFWCTCMAASMEVSMMIWQTLRTAAIDRMLANDLALNQTSPKLLMVPSCVEICVPPLVWTLRLQVLFRMLESSFRLLKTETVDWLSNKIRVSGMILYNALVHASV